MKVLREPYESVAKKEDEDVYVTFGMGEEEDLHNIYH